MNEEWLEDCWLRIVHKVDGTSRRIGAQALNAAVHGRYESVKPHDWTAGFWPGILWQIYSDTRDERLKQLAAACEQNMEEALHQFEELHHDVGFMWLPTSVIRYKLTGHAASRKSALIAASHLAGRFNLKGSYLRAWNAHRPEDLRGWAIIDCMLNLSLLYWASEETGDPRYNHIARAHADMAAEHFVREDGSVYHIVCFNPESGERTGQQAGQGYSEQSSWSRGTAWALYGFINAFRHLHNERYLHKAKQVAHFFLASLPEDQVPYWDFRVPVSQETPRDSSAAAIAASGLIELAKAVPAEEADLYMNSAKRILHALDLHYGAWERKEVEEGLLHSASQNVNRKVNVNVPLIYGDYYFVEAIAKLRGKAVDIW